MLLLRRKFHNLLGQPILLDIHRFTNCCQIMITKSNRRFDSCQWFAIVLWFVSVIFFTKDFNRMLDRLIISCLTLLLVMALIYWRSPVYKESIILLDNVCGTEVTQEYCIWGTCWKRSQFILTKDIIINEAITMHRVIYYLVAIPQSLSNLFESDDKQIVKPFSKSQTNQKNTKSVKNNNLLIPLFCNTCPRIDCLKLIYKQIHTFKTNINRVNVNPKRVFNQKLKSFSPTNSSNCQKNGLKSVVTPLNLIYK